MENIAIGRASYSLHLYRSDRGDDLERKEVIS